MTQTTDSTTPETTTPAPKPTPTTAQARTTEEWRKFGQPGSTMSARQGNVLAGWGSGTIDHGAADDEPSPTWPRR